MQIYLNKYEKHDSKNGGGGDGRATCGGKIVRHTGNPNDKRTQEKEEDIITPPQKKQNS